MNKQKKIIIGLVLFIGVISGGVAFKEYQNKSLDIAIIQVDGMTCESCEKAIEVAVKKHKDVKNVVADFKTGNVVLTYNKNHLTEDQLKKLINDTGYKIVVPKDKLIINEAKLRFMHQ